LANLPQGGFLAEPYPDVGGRFRDLLAAQKMDAREFGEFIGAHFTLVYHWIGGRRLPDGKHLLMLAAKGFSIDWLLTGRGSPALRAGGDERYEAGKLAGIATAKAVFEEALRPDPEMFARLLKERPPVSRPAAGAESAAARIDEIRQVVDHPSSGSARPVSPRKHAKKARRGHR
jgi:transcriptional regulator with XRE-family HTH domain